MTHNHPVWELLDKIQMDNRDQATKIVELRAHIASLDLPETKGQWQPAFGVKDPVAVIRKLIMNGAIADDVDLAAELKAHPGLTNADVQALRAALLDRKDAA